MLNILHILLRIEGSSTNQFKATVRGDATIFLLCFRVSPPICRHSHSRAAYRDDILDEALMHMRMCLPRFFVRCLTLYSASMQNKHVHLRRLAPYYKGLCHSHHTRTYIVRTSVEQPS